MKHTATMDDANHSFNNTVSTLRKHFTQIDFHEPEQIKLANEYYKWTTLKTNLILDEKSFQIPPIALPNTIKKIHINGFGLKSRLWFPSITAMIKKLTNILFL